jgi:hypothetical protein
VIERVFGENSVAPPKAVLASHKGLHTRFKGKPVKDKIMDMKSILLPILIVAGWLILFGIILPALGINT